MWEKTTKPFFSIVIPTLNEEKCLPILLKDLEKQTWPDFEVIHVDGQSEDGTVREALKFIERLDLKIIKSEGRGAAAQRNLGGEKAQGEWIIFMDADDQLPTYFLQGIKYRIERADVKEKTRIDIFTTAIHLNDEDSRDPLNRTTRNFLNLTMMAAETTEKPVAFGAMMGVRRAIFEKIKFSTKPKVLEDSLLVEEVKRKGFHYKFLADPTYAYSLRRIRSNGLTKTAFSSLKMNVMRLMGDDLSRSDYGYEMLGGDNYEELIPE